MRGTTDIHKNTLKEYFLWIFMIVIGVFFFFFAGERGYIVYPDSGSYIEARYEREPLYPLIIMMCRNILGENLYLYGVVVLQGVVALVACIALTQCIRKNFGLNRIETGIAFILLLFPYGLDTMWAEPRENYTHIIMSDALSYSMFYFFVIALIDYLKRKKWSSFWWMVILTSLMTLNRSQMELCYVIILIAVIFCSCHMERGKLRIGWGKILGRGCILIGAGALTILLTYCYSFFMWGEFARSSENDFTMLTNLLYASDAEDEELFSNPDTAMAFRELYGRVDDAGLTYHYAPEGFLENGKYMLSCHDPMKSGIVRAFFKEYIEEQGLTESFQSDQIKKELASELKEVLLKEHFLRWIYNGLCMVPRGIMYSVTPILPPNMDKAAYLYTVAMLIVCIALFVVHVLQTKRMPETLTEEKKRRKCLEQWVCCMAIFMVMNVVAVCIIILIIYRYVNYTQGLFFIMLYLVAKDVIKGRKLLKTKESGSHQVE